MTSRRASSLLEEFEVPGVGSTVADALGIVYTLVCELKEHSESCWALYERMMSLWRHFDKLTDDSLLRQTTVIESYGRTIASIIAFLEKQVQRNYIKRLASRSRNVARIQLFNEEIDDLNKLVYLITQEGSVGESNYMSSKTQAAKDDSTSSKNDGDAGLYEQFLVMCEQMEETSTMKDAETDRRKQNLFCTFSVGEFHALGVRFYTFLTKYKQGTALERLVSARTVVDGLKEFHVALDSIETALAGGSSETILSWMEQFERESDDVEKSLIRLWETNAMNIVDALTDDVSIRNALLVLSCETRSSWDSCSAESTELLRSVTQYLSRMSAAAVPVVPGWFIPDHEVQRERSHFARGSFGKVYRGKWRGEKVVIKCVHVVTANDERDFSREARVWLRAQHPNVNHIVHGDLKCNQILVSDDLTAKLTDFGMRFVSLESRPATTTGAVRWKTPELLSSKGTAPTFASDVYSFGMCVVEAVSGRVPWQVHLPDIAVVYHLTHGELPSRPKEFTNYEHWEFVRALCRFKPSDRMDLAAAIKQIVIFAEDEECILAAGHGEFGNTGVDTTTNADAF